jgi:hypothetical protein
LIQNDIKIYNCEIKEQLLNESDRYQKNVGNLNEDIIRINKIGDRDKNILENVDIEQKKMKQLVWKLVENLNELDEENESFVVTNRTIKNSNINSTEQSLSILVPQEIENEEQYSSSRLSN